MKQEKNTQNDKSMELDDLSMESSQPSVSDYSFIDPAEHAAN